MSVVRLVGAVVIGLVSVSGCAPAPDEADEDVGIAQQAEGGTHGGTNGLGAELTYICEGDVNTAMDVPLVTKNAAFQEVLNPALPASVLPGKLCSPVFMYAYFKCAGGAGTTLP